MRILCIGDVVGHPGREVLREALPKLAAERAIDCVVANVENAAGGSGLTPGIYEKIRGYGVHLFTLGDHIYRRKEILPLLERAENVVRPANLPSTAPGRECAVWRSPDGQRVAVISLLGRMFMKPMADCPFAAVDRVLGNLDPGIRMIVVDIHAEATAEKVAMGWHLEGRVSVVFGTHTHIPTADERILPKGTAYITDVGMTGPYDSVLGRDRERVVQALRTAVPTKFDVADEPARLCGVVVEVDPLTGRAGHIERVTADGPAKAKA